MSGYDEDITELTKCTCMDRDEMQVDDIKDADLCDPECPIHGTKVNFSD